VILINLAPPDELESPYWWAPDLLAFLLVLALGVAAVEGYLSYTFAEVSRLNDERSNLENLMTSIQPDLEQHKHLLQDIATLDAKRTALARITESKLVRYLPIILVEHIQNLKPEGLWLTRLSFVPLHSPEGGPNQGASAPLTPPPAAAPPADGAPRAAEVPTKSPSQDANDTIQLEGYAFDNILVAEFIMALKSTRDQEVDPSDVRTQLYFEDIQLDFTVAASVDRKLQERSEPMRVVQFKILLHYRERAVPDAAPIVAALPLKRGA